MFVDPENKRRFKPAEVEMTLDFSQDRNQCGVSLKYVFSGIARKNRAMPLIKEVWEKQETVAPDNGDDATNEYRAVVQMSQYSAGELLGLFLEHEFFGADVVHVEAIRREDHRVSYSKEGVDQPLIKEVDYSPLVLA